MDILYLLAGPLIGSIIGYSTNYLAVKMLFRPLRPIKIGTFRLPFTPGIIPKRKDQLARALGSAVGNNLLTSDDIEKMLLDEALKDLIVSRLADFLCAEEEHTLKTMLTDYCTEEHYFRGKAHLEKVIGDKIITGIAQLDLGEIIATESKRVIKQKIEGTMLAFIANEKMIDSLTAPLGAMLETYIKENGKDVIRPIIKLEIAKLENQPIGKILTDIGMEKNLVPNLVDKIYTQFVGTKATEFIKALDIAGVVEQKINAMDALEMEKLVLSVMKNELRAIINLGALLGLLIGTLNILI